MTNRQHPGGGRAGLHAFTLIELLVVIVMMSIMLVISLPAFEAFSRRGLTSAVPNLAGAIRLARQHAITHHKFVYVVFPDTNTTSYTGIGSEAEKALRAFAVIEGDINGTGYSYISDWKFLPKGIYFDGDPGFASGRSVFNSYSSSSGTKFPFPSEGGATNNLPALLFKPNGQAYIYSRSSSKWIQEGSFLYFEIPLKEGVADVNTNTGNASIKYVASTNLVIQIIHRTGQMRYRGL